MLTEVYKKLNITKRHTVPFNPNANQVERVHQVIAQIFRALGTDGENKWKEFLPAVTLSVNSAIHRITKFSPMFLMTGRAGRLERQLLFGGLGNMEIMKEIMAVIWQKDWNVYTKLYRKM